MKGDAVFTAIIALCCVLAIGATSTTLESTVSTDPEEVTEVGYDKIPVGTEQAKKLDDAIDGGQSASAESGPSADDSQSDSSAENSRSESDSQSAASQAAENGDRTRSASEPGEGQREQRSAAGKKTKQKQSGGSEGETKQGGGVSNSQSGTDRTLREPTLLERLVSLFRELLDVLLGLLPYAVLAAVLAAAVRYRNRILSRVAPTPSSAETCGGDAEPNPRNEIASAWFEMVERLDLADRRNLTPRECAAAARRRGADGDAVRTLTALFEEVRYGDVQVTDERRRRAEESIRRVRTQLEGQQ